MLFLLFMPLFNVINCTLFSCIKKTSVTRTLRKMISGRALHFVFKIPERKLTMKFYRDILGMKVISYLNNFQAIFFINYCNLYFFSAQVLRHEEFKDGCKAMCNG